MREPDPRRAPVPASWDRVAQPRRGRERARLIGARERDANPRGRLLGERSGAVQQPAERCDQPQPAQERLGLADLVACAAADLLAVDASVDHDSERLLGHARSIDQPACPRIVDTPRLHPQEIDGAGGAGRSGRGAACETVRQPARALIPSLRYTLVRWDSTVLGITNSTCAISRLPWPAAASSATPARSGSGNRGRSARRAWAAPRPLRARSGLGRRAASHRSTRRTRDLAAATRAPPSACQRAAERTRARPAPWHA